MADIQLGGIVPAEIDQVLQRLETKLWACDDELRKLAHQDYGSEIGIRVVGNRLEQQLISTAGPIAVINSV